MDKAQKDLAKVIENYFGADAGYLDIDCFTLARRIMEAGWTKPVPCKDCAYKVFDEANQEYYCNHTFGMYGDINDLDFCSFGERRTDG